MTAHRDRIRAALKARQSGIAGPVTGRQDPNRGDVNEGLDRPAGGPLDEDLDVSGLRVGRDGDGNVYVFNPQTSERLGDVRFVHVPEHQGTPLGAKKRDAFGRVLKSRAIERDAFGRSRRGRS